MTQTMVPQRLHVERLGRRGEGLARLGASHVSIPYALPGEEVLVDVEGDRGQIVDHVRMRPDRVAPLCPVFGRCGGCAVQALPFADYAAWKRGLVVEALDRAGIEAEVAPLVDAHGAGRRRATLHARFGHPDAPVRVGYMQARAHDLIDIDDCPILTPGLAEGLAAARRVARVLAQSGKPADIVLTETETGLDVDIRGLGAAGEQVSQGLVRAADPLDLARIANHGDVLVTRRTPVLRMGEALVEPPPGAFLQATVQGEMALAALVLAASSGARRVADLFCGIGTFALRLAALASVAAYDSDAGAVAALRRAAGRARLTNVTAETRDLFRRPMMAGELESFDTIVFDPPRAGAAAQAEQIAAGRVPTVLAVSCDPLTFARDAGILVRGGYHLERVTPIDQFRHSAHVELVAVFRKARPARKRRILG